MHEQMKIAVGIKNANCKTCANFDFESDGEEYSYYSWPVCRKFDRYQYLKPFPFKTEQKCWTPCFWHSKFTEEIDDDDASVDIAINNFVKARDSSCDEKLNYKSE